MKNYRVTNNYRDSAMTALMGYVNTNYARLVEVFGQPINGSGDGKVNSEWIIKFGGNKKWVVAAVSALVA
jgi:hypothetical protein